MMGFSIGQSINFYTSITPPNSLQMKTKRKESHSTISLKEKKQTHNSISTFLDQLQWLTIKQSAIIEKVNASHSHHQL